MADAKDNEIHNLKADLIKAQAQLIMAEQASQRYKNEAKLLKVKVAILEDRLKRRKEKNNDLKDRIKRMRPIESLDDY